MPLHPDNAARFEMFEHVLDNISETGLGLFDGCAPVIVACKTTAIAMFVCKQMRQWLDDRGMPYLPAAPREIVLGSKAAGPAIIFAKPSPDLTPYVGTSDLFIDISLTLPTQEMIEMHSLGSSEPKLVPGKTTHTYAVHSAGGWDDVLADLIDPGIPKLLDGIGKKKKLHGKLFGYPPALDDTPKKHYADAAFYDDQHVSLSHAPDAEPFSIKKAMEDFLGPPVEFDLSENVLTGDWTLTATAKLGPKILKAKTTISAGCVGHGAGMWDGTLGDSWLNSLKHDLKTTLEAKICKAIQDAGDVMLSMDAAFPDGYENAKVKGGKVTFDPKKHHPMLSVESLEELSQAGFDAKTQIDSFKEILKNAMGLKGVIDHEGTKESLLAQLKAIHFAQAYGSSPLKTGDLIDAVFPATKKTPRTLHLIDGLGRTRVLEWDVDLIDVIELPHPIPPGFVESDPHHTWPKGTPVAQFHLDPDTKDEPIVTYWERV